ncbi:hypothetical protein [Novosphingobium sp.]|uniref:hypothetical protein n=1 Tax=Novosphingobium sp. TaxID=1874826 RepID=UPI003B529131
MSATTLPARLPRLARIGAPVTLLMVSMLALAGCAKNHGELVVDDTVGVTALRTPCPIVEIPEMTGDVTVLAPGRVDSTAIDTVATLTNLRSHCNNSAGLPELTTKIDFDVMVRRNDTHGARRISYPYFSVVQRAGTTIVAKHLGAVSVEFADGQDRATAHGTATSVISRDEATLPKAIRERLLRKRKPGDTDAAVDPLSLPDVKAALARTSFEVLIGFQMTDQQLSYNATR